jgi:YHS domain-containing protein
MVHLKRYVICIAVIFTLTTGGFAFAAVEEHTQKKCPVRENVITRWKVYTDYKGKRVYFCCKPCLPEFQKDPEKYMKKLKQWGEALENAPK